jgi:hypothetical protein
VTPPICSPAWTHTSCDTSANETGCTTAHQQQQINSTPPSPRRVIACCLADNRFYCPYPPRAIGIVPSPSSPASSSSLILEQMLTRGWTDPCPLYPICSFSITSPQPSHERAIKRAAEPFNAAGECCCWMAFDEWVTIGWSPLGTWQSICCADDGSYPPTLFCRSS